MSLQSVVSQEYKKYTPVQRISTGTDIIAGYFQLPLIFITWVMTETAFTLINVTYQTLNTAANGGDDIKIQARDNYYTETWLPAVELIRKDVNAVAKGAKIVVDQSGFHSTKNAPVPAVIGDKMAVQAEAGVSGSRSFFYDSTTKIKKSSVLLIAAQQGTTVAQDGSKFTMTIPASTTPTDLVVVLGTGKKGKVGGLTFKDELDTYMSSLNAAGCSPVSGKVTIVVP